MLFGSLQGDIGCVTYQWCLNWRQGERGNGSCFQEGHLSHVHFMLVVTRRLAASFACSSVESQSAAFGERNKASFA
jgi:hypothetical protein